MEHITAKAFGATTRSSKVAKALGPAARKGGGGAGVVAKVKSFLGLNPIKSNFIGKGGKRTSSRGGGGGAAPRGKSGGGGKGG